MDATMIINLPEILNMVKETPWLIFPLILLYVVFTLPAWLPFIIYLINQKKYYITPNQDKLRRYFFISKSIFQLPQKKLRKKYGEVTLFDNHVLSKNSFFEDIKYSRKLTFYGINHTRMQDSLEEALSLENNFKPEWEHLCFYFANNEYGQIMSKDHKKLVNDNVLSLTLYLSEKKRRGELTNLKKIEFKQCNNTYRFGGSYLQNDNKNMNIIYVIMYLPNTSNSNVDENITLRLKGEKQVKANLFDRAKQSFNYLQKNAEKMFEIDFEEKENYWDISVAPLYNIETDQVFYKNVREKFFNFCSIKEGDNILDLGSGTGFFSEYIVDRIGEKVTLTLLDKSCTMLKKSKEILREHQNINYILSDVSSKNILYGMRENEKYNKIIIYFTLQYFVKNKNDIESLALKLKKHLIEEGEVFIMIHNTFIKEAEIDKKWIDPIRAYIKINVKANENFREQEYKNNYKFSFDDIIGGFGDAGFPSEDNYHPETYQYDRTINDRIEMWKVPAILNTVVEIKSLGEEDIEKRCGDFMEAVHKEIKDDETIVNKSYTPQTIAYFFKFKKKP